MPKELNLDKLEKKFTSLTKSRESIQAVSGWIMRHHEFCEEIVEHWYTALTKDQNALVMFYVANEVIQNCGKKRCPQYREAFTKVLERAASLEKVKEIKSDVCRILSLWKERSIFDEEFFERLEAKLNASEVISSPPAQEDEVSELEIITNYKSGNLFDSLKKLKAIEAMSKEKEEILNHVDEPELPDLSHFTEREECLEMIKKIDCFYNLVKDCMKALHDELKARKSAVTELHNSCIFYTAQHGDVKKVANAYMTYGKRLKNMEKKLSDKMLVLPSAVECSSPYFSESNTHLSPIVADSPFDLDTSSMSRTSSKVSPCSSNEKSHDTMLSSENLKSSTSFWSKISKKASSDFPKNFEKKSEETLQSRPEQSPKQKFSKLAELFAETKSDPGKQMGSESAVLNSLKEISNLKSSNSPKSQEENLSDLQIAADKQIDVPETAEPSAEKSSDQDTKEKLDQITKESSNEKRNTTSAEDASEIDFLLDESYDSKKAKSNVSVKRKIELLLQSKEKKICTDASKEKNSDILQSKTSAENLAMEEKSSEVITENNTKLNDQHDTDINQKKDKVTNDSTVKAPLIKISSPKVEKMRSETEDVKSSVAEDVKSGGKKNLSLEEKIQNMSNIFVPSSSNDIELCKTMDFLAERSDTQDSSSNNKTSEESIIKNNSSIFSELNFDTESSKVLENDKFSVQTPSSFFDASLFSSVSSLSSEFLKNILIKNKGSSSQNAEDNYLVDTISAKDSFEAERLAESKDSETVLMTPVFNFLESMPTQEKITSPDIETRPLAQNEDIEDDAENKTNIKEEAITEVTSTSDITAKKSSDPKQQHASEQDITSVGIKTEEKSGENKNFFSSILDAQLKPKDLFKTEKSEDKPNLMLTLQDVLECISNKSLSLGDSKNIWGATPLSFENCLSMYHALRSTDTKYVNGSSPSSSENVVLPVTTSEYTVTSGAYGQDNIEVVDMECDSE